ncbi:uncharacterized protein LOC128869149 isoform X1 [Anastrepha ludens]|uniref:uncharacterized protein LOC128869149 isoform X1 n=1 Tax=Anastrepha ludens TaxID=28586 RepID=UPI0023AF3BAC|nr:uncharacterized protein LOC128869149 isoform X1 [Anastrepha ludens]
MTGSMLLNARKLGVKANRTEVSKTSTDTYKHCNCFCDNPRHLTLPLNPLILHKSKRDTLHDKWQRSIQRHFGTISSYVTHNFLCCLRKTTKKSISTAEWTQHEESGTNNPEVLHNYQIFKLSTESTKACNKNAKSNRFDESSSYNRFHRFETSIQNDSIDANNHICASELSSGDFHLILYVSSILGKATCSSNESAIISSVKSKKKRRLTSQMHINSIQYIILILLLSLSQVRWTNSLLLFEPKYHRITDGDFVSVGVNNKSHINANIAGGSNNSIGTKASSGMIDTGGDDSGVNGGASPVANGYMDKMYNLERSVAAVLIKVAYGTTSTTKRSIPDSSHVPKLTTIATPLLTTLRYAEKSSHQQQINLHHRNYELDLERDHALPTSAPNADILKSNSNPTYPNPNRHHNHERHWHIMNSTPLPSSPNILKKNNGQLPTISMYPGDIPSYSPPARSFFTPPLPPEYQNPFADKPTLRGTNNEGVLSNTGTYINRRPIPPPSLMPGHERIPFRPPDLAASTGGSSEDGLIPVVSTADSGGATNIPLVPITEPDRKKALNTPSQSSGGYGTPNAGTSNVGNSKNVYDSAGSQEVPLQIGKSPQQHRTKQEVLPSIIRILSGSNGNKGEIPEVLLKQATTHPFHDHSQPPSSPVMLLDGGNTAQQVESSEDSEMSGGSNINQSKTSLAESSGSEIYDAKRIETAQNKSSGKPNSYGNHSYGGTNGSKMSTQGSSSTPATGIATDEELGTVAGASSVISTSSTVRSATIAKSTTLSATVASGNIGSGSRSSISSSTAAAASSQSTWDVAWNIHVYFSVVLFTILAVYSLYKVLTYNKLTHLFSQSYFLCIHLVLIVTCSTRIFYLCYDAYNIHATFNLFVSELLLNLPATLLTISFSILILYLFVKALNHKNNRYSALIRPLTVVVGCGVHVVLCITLHYVESYTLQNQQQQHLLYQQQQQQLLYRRQQQQQFLHQLQQKQFIAAESTNLLALATVDKANSALLLQSAAATTSSLVSGASPPRVLSLICQIIYIFVCMFLGLLYLYLYRVLKRILRSKSQNYIHGYQNLSYAIHVTIATALLFVLLAALQIFGAISISTTRPLIQQLTAEIDWLQWGYQFSLRLIEIAIITLLSWVAGLKTSGGSSSGAATTLAANGNARYGVASANGGGNVFDNDTVNREKFTHHHFHHNHSNVTGFFLPCTSSSSQEQFDTDYPAVCNANTNLHTYTMRTGKLIYDDSYALNSLSRNGKSQRTGLGNSVISTSSASTRVAGEFQLQTHPTYQRPYDSGSLNSAVAKHNASEYGTRRTLASGGGRYCHDVPQYADYLMDATTDHYENPNFDLCGSGFCIDSENPNGAKKFTKTSTTSTTASSSGGSGSSAASQKQMLLLQNDNCYSEPLQPSHTSTCNFSNLERPHLGGGESGYPSDCWSESHAGQPHSQFADSHKSKREKKIHTTLDRSAYEKPERRSSNSTHSCASSTGRYGGYNSFDRGIYNGVRKSGTLNNIVVSGNGGGHVAGVGIMHGRNSSSSSATSSNVSTQRASASQTLAQASERPHQQQQVGVRGNNISLTSEQDRDHDRDREDEHLFKRSSLDRSNTQQQNYPQLKQKNPDDDMMLSGCNVERTNLISNEDGSCITTSSNTSSICGGRSQLNDTNAANPNTENYLFGNTHLKNNIHSTSSSYNTSVSSMIASENAGNRGNDTAMIVAEHGFVRFRAIDDMNNAQGIGIHNASVRN